MTTTSTAESRHSLETSFVMDCVLFSEDKPLEQILIVDDEEAIRNLFTFCLQSRYVCVEAASVPEALELLAENNFELIVSDLMMPGMTGVELIDRVAEISPDTVVIMASGVDDPHSALEAVRRGAFDYLIKPCNLTDLEFTVERALENRRLKLEARRYKLDLENRNRQLAHGKAELERLQAQIVHHEKMASLGQLAAGIAHEINNPVGFIYGNLDVLDRYVGDLRELLEFYDRAEMSDATAGGANAIKEKIGYESLLGNLIALVEDCHEGAARISGIVKNLRTFSRLDDAQFAKTDVCEGIDTTIRLLSQYYGAGNLTLTRDYADLPMIDAFAGQLNQVWMNLLVNAAQAVGSQPGQVAIRTFVEKDSVVVEISDSGTGIPPELLNRIFEPFFTTKPVGEGTGLGLSISFGIIEQHHGTIEVESNPNHGTIFTVRLPIDNSRLLDEMLDINQEAMT